MVLGRCDHGWVWGGCLVTFLFYTEWGVQVKSSHRAELSLGWAGGTGSLGKSHISKSLVMDFCFMAL